MTDHKRRAAGATDCPVSEAERKRMLNQRLRLAFLQGAEDQSRQVLHRGLTADELRRVLGGYP